MIEVNSLKIDGLLEIVPMQFCDDRGFFSETFNASRFADRGINTHFVQDNHSFSRNRWVLRGLHYQLPPFAQDKLVRVARGAAYDVVVDFRKGSPTFGNWVGLELSAKKWNQLFVPKGFLHGFLTLENDTELLYKVSAPYSAAHDRAVRFDDPKIGIQWPGDIDQFVLSEKDRNAPGFDQAENGFIYEASNQ